MRVLLDECLPRPLKRELPGHTIATVPEQGWAGQKNGALLRLAATRFDVFVTVDQNLTYQQNLQALAAETRLAIAVLVSPSNRLEALRPLIPSLLEHLKTIQPSDVVRIVAQASVQ